MSTTPDPDPDAAKVKTIDRRITYLNGALVGSSILAVVLLAIGTPLFAWNWNAMGAGGPFGLGLMLDVGFFVTITWVGATFGHRATSQTMLFLAELIARLERHEAHHDTTGHQRGTQIDLLTAEVAKLNRALAGVEDLGVRRNTR